MFGGRSCRDFSLCTGRGFLFRRDGIPGRIPIQLVRDILALDRRWNPAGQPLSRNDTTHSGRRSAAGGHHYRIPCFVVCVAPFHGGTDGDFDTGALVLGGAYKQECGITLFMLPLMLDRYNSIPFAAPLCAVGLAILAGGKLLEPLEEDLVRSNSEFLAK